MFHLHTFDSIKFNIPLESLKTKKDIKKLNKNTRSRKYISNEDSSSNEKYTYAINAYKDAVKITSEKEKIFHAYEIMNSPVKTVGPEMTIIEAWNFCKGEGVGHLPIVTSEKKLIGIISDRDLLKHLIIEDEKASNIPGKTIGSIMTDEVITASSVTDIRRIAKVMFEHHIGSMPVVDEKKSLTGIITRSDILYALINHPQLKLWA